MTEGLRTVLLAAGVLTALFAWHSIRVASIATSSPERLVGELRLAQLGALLLALSSGAYVGIAATHETSLGVGLDVALVLGFFLVAAWTMLQDPRVALTTLALAFAAEALFAVAHRPGLLPAAIVPTWYTIGGAVYDVLIGAFCYLPILRRP